ncbi:hypothetical protein DL766_009387 [Monosporascus sp. MC13-8B]|uniref:KaiC-like domain-containing protein n=1 Tax=Monosporascus cannonballus TaxID=155416 RepID=A0ABY0GUZ7_9PEZI|nr:hypothetical protein DL763_011190 [Monosporascus cannonballus]RYO78135.1 hypothetical protein DL762_008847 [Monosporascus cannonballus]RYP15503.1 hypothetical protein DL766_009387 [Monosporascus sp. MC13-8B]
MDYHSIHGQDISSFDLTSTPAQALEDISTDPRRYISTGIRALDNALVGDPSDDGDASPGIGGFQRGQVIEIWGPPGSGKTALGMQLAVNALRTGAKVIWCATRMQAERGATLVPAINANAWEQGIAGRLVLFKDWTIRNGRLESAHFTGIQKLDGRSLPGAIGQAFAFNIQSVSCPFLSPQIKAINLVCKDALVEIETDGSQPSLVLSTSHGKRKLDETDFELADSEDEDYGWDDEDAIEMPTVPQWQGSEDILLGHKDDDGNQSEATSDDHPQDPDVSP